MEIHTAKPSVPDPSPFEVKIATAKLKSIHCQEVIILEELIQAGG
jgi:hypothetical protein